MIAEPLFNPGWVFVETLWSYPAPEHPHPSRLGLVVWSSKQHWGHPPLHVLSNQTKQLPNELVEV
jgi:hypothetical protein